MQRNDAALGERFHDGIFSAGQIHYFPRAHKLNALDKSGYEVVRKEEPAGKRAREICVVNELINNNIE